MTADLDRLFRLLPAIHRQRDAQAGGPLQALLAVITEQLNRVDEDIGQLYENWFIETCEDWAVPYLGALVGYQAATPASLPDVLDSRSSALLARTLIPRRDVANTVSHRRRKGTLSGLTAQLADISGWHVHAEESATRLAMTQSANDVRGRRGRSVGLRDRHALARLGSAFDHSSRTVQLRSADSMRTGNAEALERVRIHLWRQYVQGYERVPAHCADDDDSHRFRFDVTGLDIPLWARPETVDNRLVLPGPITRLGLARMVGQGHRSRLGTDAALYGLGRSIAIWAPGWEKCDASAPIPLGRIVVADLSDWAFEPPPGHVAVDPERGRLSFPSGMGSIDGVWVSYCSACPCPLGAGPWARRLAYQSEIANYLVGVGMPFTSVHDALEQWHHDAPASAIIEIVDSEIYSEVLLIKLRAGHQLVLRAASGARPLIRPAQRRGNRPDLFTVHAGPGSVLELNGLMLRGRPLEVSGELAQLRIVDCTLLPGSGRRREARAEGGAAPSLVLLDTAASIRIARSICAGLRTVRTRSDLPPGECRIEDSVVDGGDETSPAISGDDGRLAAFEVTLRRCTVLGRIHCHAMPLAENCLLVGEVRVARRQHGCLRCSYVASGSQTPARYLCQPDMAEEALAGSLDSDLSATEREVLLAAKRRHVRPIFNSTRAGMPGYMQLAADCAQEISRGADDIGEMGVHHDLFTPQRLDMLLERLAESLPVGVEASLHLVD